MISALRPEALDGGGVFTLVGSGVCSASILVVGIAVELSSIGLTSGVWVGDATSTVGIAIEKIL